MSGPRENPRNLSTDETADMLNPTAGQLVVTSHGEILGEDNDESRELARRVKACINACEGISTEELERGIIHDMCRVLNQVAPLLETKIRDKQDEKAA